jgi:hypothetical protein
VLSARSATTLTSRFPTRYKMRRCAVSPVPRTRTWVASAVTVSPSADRSSAARACCTCASHDRELRSRRYLRRVTCGSSARARRRGTLCVLLTRAGAVPATLIIATSHRGCAAGAHPQHQVRVLPSDWLHVGPGDVGEPQQTGLAQQHATQRLLGSLTPCVHQPSGCPDLVRPSALAARRHRRAPHSLSYPAGGAPFEP